LFFGRIVFLDESFFLDELQQKLPTGVCGGVDGGKEMPP
jgi:hypothetical protein